MNFSFFHRRRAERFAQLLDDSNGARHPDPRSTDDRELPDLVAISRRLDRIDIGAQADPEFRSDLRAMLMATIEREGIGASAVGPDLTAEPARRPAAASGMTWVPIRSRRARGAVVVGLAVGALAVTGLSAIGIGAGPGDTLYGMKRSTEKAQLALSSSQTGRGQLYLEFAKTRMSEAATGQGDVAAVLAEMDDETRQGVRLLTTAAVDRRDPASLDPIDAFVAEQRHTIAGVLNSLTGGVRTRTIGSLQLLDQVKKRVDGLRASLGCAAAASSLADDLGPVPVDCGSTGPSTGSTYQAPVESASTASGATKAPETEAPFSSTAGTSGGTSMPRQPSPAPAASTPRGNQPANDSLLDQISRRLGLS